MTCKLNSSISKPQRKAQYPCIVNLFNVNSILQNDSFSCISTQSQAEKINLHLDICNFICLNRQSLPIVDTIKAVKILTTYMGNKVIFK